MLWREGDGTTLEPVSSGRGPEVSLEGSRGSGPLRVSLGVASLAPRPPAVPALSPSPPAVPQLLREVGA